MTRSFIKYAGYFAAFAVVGPVASWLLSTLRAVDGDPHTTPLTAATPAEGIVKLLLVILIAMGIAVLVGRFASRGAGIVAGSCIFLWAALATGNVRQVLGDADAHSALLPLALESLILLGGLALISVVVECLSPLVPEERGQASGPVIPPAGFAGLKAMFEPRVFLASLAAAFIAAGIVGWLASITPYKGQSIFAAFLGGLAAGWASSSAAGAAHHRDRPPSLIPAILALQLVAAATFLYLKASTGASLIDMTRAIGSNASSQLFSLGRIMPLDWAAGGLLGVPVGASWAASMVEHHHPLHPHGEVHSKAA